MQWGRGCGIALWVVIRGGVIKKQGIHLVVSPSFVVGVPHFGGVDVVAIVGFTPRFLVLGMAHFSPLAIFSHPFANAVLAGQLIIKVGVARRRAFERGRISWIGRDKN